MAAAPVRSPGQTDARGALRAASAHGVARLLTATLPRVEVVAFDTLGHMGPITDPDTVNAAIARSLERH
jgi:pimeloyl-ACP methyl ester carboxylesterase